MIEPKGRLIRTRFHDSVCVRCGHEFDKGDVVMHLRPFGVWCMFRCVPEFPEPEGQLAEVLGKLEKLEREERLKGFTQGLLDRYRLVGRLSPSQLMCLTPTNKE